MSSARYKVAAVTQMTGISPFVLRMWERRYGPFARTRTDGGGRLYDDEDVARLRLVKRLVDAGHAIGEVARLAPGELSRITARYHAAPARDDGKLFETVADRFVEAVSRLDTDAAARAFTQGALFLDPIDVVEKLARPILQRIGDGWESGVVSIAVEHAATAVIRAHLETFLRRGTGPRCVSATPEGELHEIGALGAAIAASRGGWDVVYLSASVPAVELAGAVRQLGARAALLSIVALPPRLAKRSIGDALRELPAGCELVVGGAGVPADVSRDVRVARDLSELVRHLGEIARKPPEGTSTKPKRTRAPN